MTVKDCILSSYDFNMTEREVDTINIWGRKCIEKYSPPPMSEITLTFKFIEWEYGRGLEIFKKEQNMFKNKSVNDCSVDELFNAIAMKLNKEDKDAGSKHK